MAQILDGKKVSSDIRSEIKSAVSAFIAKGEPVPGLAVIIVGDDPASKVYVSQKKKNAEEVGFHSEEIKLPHNASRNQIISEIQRLNNNSAIHGILVQMPLPDQSDQQAVIEAISPRKDVDAFHPVNQGKFLIGIDSFLPCTPAGVIELLKRYLVEISGKKALVIGRSNIVGKPMSLLLLRENATVTIAHSKTKNLESEISDSDIVVAALGKPHAIKGEWLKKGAVVVDVGMHRIDDPNAPKGTKLVGDIDYGNYTDKLAWYSPVPGGVGPMTIAMLLSNTLKARNDLCRKTV
ncbi:MAG: bifunctional methylenetetrahydrofolate dehydrogenase/methenyltetrahydrofolate cyclohydrolase FolD [Candidatus Riflebacteria bacterium]|nr:bifunctional methylenetetrahydrofolate dehydrogenase/methenyltetrahydrofolate cyclohydrolase FolD [Candidatus Riflebacteria bacterium]